MKYAITGPRGRIFRVLDTEPLGGQSFTEITDEQATTVESSETPLFIINGELKSQEEAMEIFKAERMAERLTELFNEDPIKAKSQKRKDIAKDRYDAEVGGIIINGAPIKTDRDTQSIIGNSFQMAKLDVDFSVDWKVAEGVFIELDSPTIIAIGQAVVAHVQSCFTKEKDLNILIDNASTAEELNNIKW